MIHAATVKRLKDPKIQQLISENKFYEIFKPVKVYGDMIIRSLSSTDMILDMETIRIFDESDIEYLPFMKSIVRSSYMNREDIKQFHIPSNIKVIEEHAFQNCTNLSQIDIEEGVRVIEDYAFSGCKKLKIIHLPDSVLQVGASAFSGCSSIVEISMGKNVQFEEKTFYGSSTYKINFRGTVKECEKVLGLDRIWSSRTKSKTIQCLDGKYTWRRK